MKLHIELTEEELRELVVRHLESLLNVPLTEKDVQIEVKSKQNYRSEWESAAFRAIVRKGT